MSNNRLYPVRGDDPRLTGSQGIAFNPLDYGNKGDAVNNFLLFSGSGSVVFNPTGISVIGKGSFDFTGNGVWVLNTLYPVSYEAGVKGTVDYRIASGSATLSIGYEPFASDGLTSLYSVSLPTRAQCNFLLDQASVTLSSYTQSTNTVRGEGVANNNVPVGTRYIRPRIEISGSSGIVSIDALILSQFLDDVLPAGVTFPFAGASLPQGYLFCDGASVLRTQYSRLFASIGTAYGSTSGTTFNLPDLRGRFIRGVDAGSAHDPDAASRLVSNTGGNSGSSIGSLQLDEFNQHSHPVNNQGVGTWAVGGVLGMVPGADALVGGGNTGNAGGNETRPKNVYFNHIIKY